MPSDPVRAPRDPRRRRAAFLALLTTTTLVPGCVANSSNPEVRISHAVASDDAARFDLRITNPGGRNLVVRSLNCQISQGESSFPVAQTEWKGEVPLPAKGSAVVSFRTPLDTPSPEPGSRLFHLNGELILLDRTGYLGLKSMDLTRTTFQGDVQAKEGAP